MLQPVRIALCLALFVVLLVGVYATCHATPRSSPTRMSPSWFSRPKPCYPVHDPQPHLRLLFGIFLQPEQQTRRHLLRRAYERWKPFLHPSDHVQFVHVVAHSQSSPDLRRMLDQEQQRHQDLLFVGGQENMNQGKTFEFLKAIEARAVEEEYDVVFKLDSDAYVNLPAVLEELRSLAKEASPDLIYWGAHGPQKPENTFHYGSLYGLSTPLLLELTNQSYTYPSQNTLGPEDKLVGQWIHNLPPRVRNRVHVVNNEGRFVDGPSSATFKSDWRRPVAQWAAPPANAQQPACGADGDMRKEVLMVHQLKRDQDLEDVVAWWIDGLPIGEGQDRKHNDWDRGNRL